MGEIISDDFKSKYTTAELKQIDVKEKDKIVLSNDFYMLGQYLELLSNRGLR